MGCGGSTQARSPTARQQFRDPTPGAHTAQAPLGAYPSTQPQPVYSQAGYNPQQPGYNPQQMGYNPQQPGYNQNAGYVRPMAPGGDPAYPPPAYPPPAPVQPSAPPAYPMQPSAPPAYPVQPSAPGGYPVQQQMQTTVIVRERRRSSGDEGLAIMGGLAMGAMMGAALHGSFSSCSSGFSF